MIEPVIIGNATLYQGDCLAVLATLPDNSVHCCVTSPPYFGLRSYLPDTVKLRDDISNEDRQIVLRELATLSIRPIMGEV